MNLRMEPQRLTATLRQGDCGPEVKLVQEWLSLRGTALNITSHFGAPTEAAVLDFCAAHGLEPQTAVDAALFERLMSPMLEALSPVSVRDGVRGTLVAIAERQLAQGPREVGGVNGGPWVRLYMRGQEGASAPWSAGFASFCLERACEVVGEPVPFATSTRVGELVHAAMQQGRVRAPSAVASICAGDLFVTRAGPARVWSQVGVVRAVDALGFESIEGGGRVVSKRRSFDACDFLRTAS